MKLYFLKIKSKHIYELFAGEIGYFANNFLFWVVTEVIFWVCLGCTLNANFQHEEHGPTVPSVRVFLRDPSPHLRELDMIGKRKTPSVFLLWIKKYLKISCAYDD